MPEGRLAGHVDQERARVEARRARRRRMVQQEKHPTRVTRTAEERETRAKFQYPPRVTRTPEKRQEIKRKREAADRKIEAAGFGGGPDIGQRVARDLRDAAAHMPGGVFALSKAVTLDVNDLLRGRPQRAKRTAGIGKAIGEQYAKDYRHPIRYAQEHPGFVGLDLLAALSAGAGGATRVGAAGRTLRAGEGTRAALTRPGARGGSLLHRPEPGTVEVAPGVNKPLSRNPLRRGYQHKRAERVRGAIDEGREAFRGKLGDELSAESVVGRELRATRRIESDLAKSGSIELRNAVRGLSKDERSAIGVAGIEGKRALENPGEVAARHRATHKRFVTELEGELAQARATRSRPRQVKELERAIAQNRTHLRALAGAERALANPSPRLVRAMETARRVADETEGESIRRGLLDSEQAAARKASIARLYGHEEAPEGAFYFPLSKAYTERFTRPAAARAYTPQLQATGVPKPAAGRYWPGRGQRFSGASVKAGGVGPRVGEHVADVAARRSRLFSALDFHEQLRGFSTATKETADQIPLRLTTGVSDELKRTLSAAEERALATPGEAARMSEAELGQVENALRSNRVTFKGRDVDPGDVPLGTEIEGVRWVDRRYLKDVDTLAPRSELGRFVDDVINRPARFAFIYARPAYILNKLGNWTMLAVTEGASFPRVMKDAHHAEKSLGSELVAKVDAGMGSTRTTSYLSRRSKAGQMTQDIQDFWRRVTDQTERRAAFFGEARRAGFTDDAAWRELLASDAPEIAAKRVEVFRRARKNIVDFDSMTPAEQQVATYVFVYPWLTRGSAWAVHATAEHPVKVATLANLGEATHEDLMDGLDLPSWLENAIPIEIEGETYIVNPTSVNTFQTATEVGASLVGGAKGAAGLKRGRYEESLGDILSPSAELLVAGAGGDDRQASLRGLLESIPPYTALERAGLVGEPPKTYPTTGAYEAVAPFVAGGLAPRQADTEWLAEKAQQEQDEGLSSAERAQTRVREDAGEVMAGLRENAPEVLRQNPGLTKRLRQAYSRKQSIDVARAEVRREVGTGEPYAREALRRELELLREWGLVGKQTSRKIAEAVESGPPDEVAYWRDAIRDEGLEKAYLALLREAREAAGVSR